jgi:predicted SprT family Zn-dependent metalloprotease
MKTAYRLRGMSQPQFASIASTAQVQIAALARKWGIPSEALEVGFTENPRLRRAVARFRRDLRVIELGPIFFAEPARQAEVLCHELAHVAIAFLHGPKVQVHGPEWRALVEMAGYRPAARVARAASTGEPAGIANKNLTQRAAGSKPFYEHRCPVCQMVRRAKRPVPQWRCAACVVTGLPGTLEIERTSVR